MTDEDRTFAGEAAELEAELRRHGFELGRLQDWISGPTPAAAERYLVECLNHAQSDGIREMIARILTQKGFGGAVTALIDAFRRCSDDSARWAIGHAIAYIGFTKSHWSDLLALAASPAFGRGRQFIVRASHRIKLPDTETILLALLDDRDVDAFALRALTYCGSYSAFERLRGFDATGRSVLFKRTLKTGLPRLAKKLKGRPN